MKNLILIILVIFGQNLFAQHVVVSNLSQNTLLLGMWNPLEMACEQCNFDSIIISTSSGKIRQENNSSFFVLPNKTGPTTIYFHGIKNSDTTIIDSRFFEVKQITHTLALAGKTNGSIRLHSLKHKPKFSINTEEIACLDIQKSLSSFTLTLFRNGRLIGSIHVLGNSITPEAKELINLAQNNDRILISNAAGKIGNQEYYFAPIELKVIL